MNDECFDAMRQSLKMSGMADEQIEKMIQMQKAAMQLMPDPEAMQEAAAGAQAAVLDAFGAMISGDDDEFIELVEDLS